jgi:hypothetical protein
LAVPGLTRSAGIKLAQFGGVIAGITTAPSFPHRPTILAKPSAIHAPAGGLFDACSRNVNQK